MRDEPNVDRTVAETRFMWAVQALARSASEQMALYPAFAVVTDELALEHDETQSSFLAAGPALSDAQRRALRALDSHLEAMSTPGSSNWCDDALRTGAPWARARLLAVEVLDAMGWDRAVPPFDRGAVYVPTGSPRGHSNRAS
jgi:hypothetical protein